MIGERQRWDSYPLTRSSRPSPPLPPPSPPVVHWMDAELGVSRRNIGDSQIANNRQQSAQPPPVRLAGRRRRTATGRGRWRGGVWRSSLELADRTRPGLSQRASLSLSLSLSLELIAPRLTVVIATRSGGRDGPRDPRGVLDRLRALGMLLLPLRPARRSQIRDTLARSGGKRERERERERGRAFVTLISVPVPQAVLEAAFPLPPSPPPPRRPQAAGDQARDTRRSSRAAKASR
jgi:hypothetical protein